MSGGADGGLSREVRPSASGRAFVRIRIGTQIDRKFDRDECGDPTPPGWSRDFDAWLGDHVARGDVAGLSDPSRAPGMPCAHPTAEHYTPLLVTLGAATAPETAPPTTAIDGWFMGLSKRSLHAT